MSNQTNSRNINSSMKRAPPKCTTCEKAGLSGKALEHFPRKTPDPNSEIVCPTIRGYKCGFCGESGHSKGFCKAFQLDQVRKEQEYQRRVQDEERRKVDRKVQDEKLKQLTAKKLKSNIFTAFEDEEEEEAKVEKVKEQVKVKAENDFPSLLKTPTKVQENTKQLYFAKIATNAAHLPVPKPKEQIKKSIEDEEYYEEYFEEDSNNDYEEESNNEYSNGLNEEYNCYNVNTKKVYGYDINEEQASNIFEKVEPKENVIFKSFAPAIIDDDSW